MKKISISILTIFLAIVFTGCSQSYIALTEDESNAIAQYCSHLILKYDKNGTYKEKLLDKGEFEDEMEARRIENESVITAEPTPEITSEPAPVTPPDTDTGDVPADVTDDPDNPDNPEGDSEGKAPAKDASVIKLESNDITDIYGSSEFLIKCMSFSLLDKYKEDSDYFAISPPAGKKLLLYTFGIRNTASSELTFKSVDYKLSFVSEQNDLTKTEASLSFISDDLQFLNRKIAPGETVAAHLIFYIDQNAAPTGLFITDNTKDSSGNTYEILINNIAEVENGN